jgi:glucan biosynthesis protein C
LLHLPIIVVVAYYLVQWKISILWKAIFLTITSLAFTVSVYWFIVRLFNVLRLVFGMKVKPKEPKVFENHFQTKGRQLAYRKSRGSSMNFNP